MPSAHADGPFRTLRFQLTFWNTAVLLLLAVVTLFGLRAALDFTMVRDLDRLLSEDITEVKLILERLHDQPALLTGVLDRKARGHTEDAWFVQVFTEDGGVLASSRRVPVEEPPPRAGSPRRAYTTGDHRIVQRRAEVPGLPTVVIRVGASLKNVDEDVTRLTKLALVAGGMILLAAPLAGYWLAGRATRPLAAILETTQRLRPDHMGERLPRSGSGDELDRLSATINGLLDRIADHLARQRDFVANAAHELRSPLAALCTTVEVALDQDRPAEEYRDLLADLAEECQGLGTVVNQLLLLAEGDAGRLRPGSGVARLDELAARSVEMFRGVAEQKGVELLAPALEPAPVRGSAGHVRQVVQNLIDNAIKFTPGGGRVTVRVEAGPTAAVLRVEDTGPGIAAEDLPHVLDRFYRADKSRQRGQDAGGSGLGLSICQAIVTAYGGRIQVESPAGGGTRVTASLPLAAPAPHA